MLGGPGDRSKSTDRARAPATTSTEEFLFHLYREAELLQDARAHEAKAELERALELEPGDAKGRDLLAAAHLRLGLYPRAIELGGTEPGAP